VIGFFVDKMEFIFFNCLEIVKFHFGSKLFEFGYEAIFPNPDPAKVPDPTRSGSGFTTLVTVQGKILTGWKKSLV
jgi:hypothetical protein